MAKFISFILSSRRHAHFVWKLVIVINYFSLKSDYQEINCMYFLGHTCPANFLLSSTENFSGQCCHALTELNLSSIQWISSLLHHFPLHSRALYMNFCCKLSQQLNVSGLHFRSDVLGQVMPLVGRDWSQSGVARLFSAIKVWYTILRFCFRILFLDEIVPSFEHMKRFKTNIPCQ